MASSTWTQADLAAIERAIASGRLTIRYGDGKLVTYRSLEDLFKIRDEITKALGALGPRRRVAATDKGLRPGSIDRRDGSWGL